MLLISQTLSVPLSEISLSATRSQGAGGQHVNKTSSAIHLRFDVAASSLPDPVKTRMMQLSDQRSTQHGVIVIKAQEHRSQEKNREAALERLRELIAKCAQTPRERRATKPTRSSELRRVEGKTLRGRIKALRRSVDD
jgi:ribosome-associated protein